MTTWDSQSGTHDGDWFKSAAGRLADLMVSWYLWMVWYPVRSKEYIYIYLQIQKTSVSDEALWKLKKKVWQPHSKPSICLNLPNVDGKPCWKLMIHWDFPPPTVRREKGFRGSSTCDSNPGGRFFISACNFSWICLEKYRHLVTQNVVGCGEVSQQRSQDMPKFILCLKHSQLRWTRRPLLVLGNRDDSWQDRFGGLTMEKTIIEATGKNHKTNTLLLVEYQSLGEANKIKKY